MKRLNPLRITSPLALCSVLLLMIEGTAMAIEVVGRSPLNPNRSFITSMKHSASRLKQNTSTWGEQHTGPRTSTGTRDDCPAVNLPVIALMPYTNWSSVTSRTPTLWVYIPYSSNQVAYGEFRLQHNGEDILSPTDHPDGTQNRRMRFAAPTTPSFIPISVPPLEPGLKPGVDYRWFVNIYCNEDSSVPIYVSGWFQYPAASEEMTAELEAGHLADYQVYWNHGFWIDAIDAMMQQRTANFNNDLLLAHWIDSLYEEELSALIKDLMLLSEPNF